MRTLGWLLIICFTLVGASSAQNDKSVALMPMPANIRQDKGQFLITPSLALAFQGYSEPRLKRAGERFLKNLSRQTGIPLRAGTDDSHANFILKCSGPSEKTQALSEDESYRLEVTPTGVRLDAANPLGLLRGMQTFLQLVQVGPDGYAAPALLIEDHPRFPWRGLSIDVSRHFIPLEVLERNLDAMEAVKFNVLHWHLSDDQGFRVESKKFPKLQQMSSDGLYYTQAEVHQLVEYAHDRGIRVVPEFDTPGHTTSWFVAYPDLASGSGPYQIERKWGIFDPAMDPTRERTYEFLNELFAEMTKLFPDQYFHVGGDEVNGKQWDANPEIQKFMKLKGLKNNEDLQGYFNTRLQKIVTKHGKTMEGWDEVLHPGVPKDIVIQSWRGQKALAEAARQGYRGLLSNGYYLDLMQPASFHYLVDPLSEGAENLSADEKQRILGGEACMWSEFVTPENFDARVWPRAAAIAERLWSPQETRSLDSMYRRLEAVSQNLEWRGLHHRSIYELMLQRLSGESETRDLQVLADLLEPVKIYERGQLRNYDSTIPLNRLVDAVRPESDTARNFAQLVDRGLANRWATSEEMNTVRNWLTTWRDNHKQLEPVLQKSQPLNEIVPISKDVETIATAGLQALDYLNAGGSAPAEWRQQQLASLKQAEKPRGEMLIMIIPSVQRLVDATTPK